MLKFFRRIRQKLIDEGNLKRYLIYTVGEIILVKTLQANTSFIRLMDLEEGVVTVYTMGLE